MENSDAFLLECGPFSVGQPYDSLKKRCFIYLFSTMRRLLEVRVDIEYTLILVGRPIRKAVRCRNPSGGGGRGHGCEGFLRRRPLIDPSE